MKIFVKHGCFLALSLVLLVVMNGCRHHVPPKHDIVHNIQKLDESVQQDIGKMLAYMQANNGLLDSGFHAFRPKAVGTFYAGRQNSSRWSREGKLNAQADSLLQVLLHVDDLGLEPSWYHVRHTDSLSQELVTDTIAAKDAAAWARLDIWLTNAFMKLAVQLHYGVLPRDSISLRKDSTFNDDTLVRLTDSALQHHIVKQLLDSLQPHYPKYIALKQALKQFRQQYAGRDWDTLPLNYTDTVLFQQQLAARLYQSGDLDSADMRDNAVIKRSVKNFQQVHNLYPDGVAGARTLRELNLSKTYRTRQIGANLERWRHLPDTLPSRYLWVNIPEYMLELWDDDTLRIRSRIIVGAPATATPLLNSRITNFIMYPYWRVPFSIIVKEILPAIKRDTGYLRRKRLEVIDRHNNAVDPATINWKKYSKNYFPFVLQQSEGLDNSLGILKFNFSNKYNVYLHDTNARGLFVNSYRALSHGCVRVKEWEKLMYYLVKEDTVRNPVDSLQAWLAEKQKRIIYLRDRIPVYIRYFTCTTADGHLRFYEDIYGDDSTMIRQLYGN